MTTFTIGDMTLSGASGGRELSADAPLVLLVHGAGMDRTVWALQTRWLAHHGVAALAIDLPGHGASPEPALESIEAYGEWLARVVQAAGRPVHLVGHSMGTFVALEAALRASVGSVTLIGTAAAMPVHPKLLEAAEANDPLAAQLMSGWAFAQVSRSGPHPSPGSTMVGGTQALIAQSAPGILHADLAMCAAYEGATAAAAGVQAPITFLLGQTDRMTPVANAQPVIDAVDGARIEIAPGVGHMVMIEAPRLTRQVIVETVTAV